MQPGDPSMRRPANRLIDEKSPYLLQHAHNPVDWYPWGEAAFARARDEDKPIFLSVGYSTCHWCHVMARESFEDEAIAAFLNAHFVAVKVDREERPDVDRIYMLATQAISGSGGWPMTVLLTPALEPFYAGTYFAPQSRPGMPGLDEVLRAIHRLWQDERSRITTSATQLRAMLTRYVTARPMPEAPDASSTASMFSALGSACARQYDPVCGGFGDAPKFPRPALLRGLLCAQACTGDVQALDMVLGTLRGMARGGLRDHLGGGFHRYSTDRYWCVPHFEKMLYDQAQLAVVYLEAHQYTGDPAFARVVVETLDYVLRDLRDPQGAFHSAEDADSAVPEQPYVHAEGAFYLWRAAEIDALLGAAAPVFRHVYGIRDDGNAPQDPMQEFVGKNLLFEARTPADAADTFGQAPEVLAAQLAEARRCLLQARQHRPRPHLDDKVIVAWNGWMISALARAAQGLDRPDYSVAAAQAADFLLSRMRTGDVLLRRYRDGEVAMTAQLEDYAALIQGLLDLYETDFQWRWLEAAQRLTATMIERFADPAGGFFETADDDPSLLLRMKEAHDGAEPAANSIAALNLLRLGALCGREDWQALGRATVEAFASTLREQPMAMPQLLLAAQFASAPPEQIVLAGQPESPDIRALLRAVWRRPRMNTLLILADGGEAHRQLARAHPEIASMAPTADGRAQAYVCRNFSCAAPVHSPEALAALLMR